MKDRLSELILVLLLCLAPWAFGSVEAWAESGLYAGIGMLTILDFRHPTRRNRWNSLTKLPSLALLGLVLLAFFQASPLQPGVLSSIAPSLARDRAQLLPLRAESVAGDTNPAVELPAATLSLEPDLTLQMAARLSAAWLLFQAVLGLRGPGVERRLARAVVVNAALLSLFAIVQGLTWNGCIYWLRPAHASMDSWSVGGPFLNHSHLAAYLNMALGLALGLLQHGEAGGFIRRGTTKPGTAYAAAIIAVGVIGSHSRSGFLGLVSASVVFACLLRGRLIPRGFGLAVVLTMIVLCLAILAGFSPLGSRLVTILDVDNEGYLTRLQIWRGAILAWWARPVWGSGFGAFPVAIIPYLTRSKGVFFARAENEFIDMLVEGGGIGFALVLAFLAGIAALAHRAIREQKSGVERGLVGGAIFGLTALSVGSLADFAPHVPAVGVLAIVLCGMIVRQGRDPQCLEPDVVGWSSIRWLWPNLRWLGGALLSVVLIYHAVLEAWIEYRLDRAGLPIPGTYMPSVGMLATATGPNQSREVARVGIQTNVGTIETAFYGLDQYRRALEEVMRQRPNWSEGYLRLGMVHLGLSRELTSEPLDRSTAGGASKGPGEPFWIPARADDRPQSSTRPPGTQTVLTEKSAQGHLVRGARYFLEARRCSPFLALPHAELATLHFLMNPADPASSYATRALKLSGNDAPLLMYLAQIAVQAGDRTRAAVCWRKSLKVDPTSWTEIADAARKFLTSDEILREVATDAGDAIRFADRLYPGAQERLIRNRFLEVALERFAVGRDKITTEQLFLEGHALARLDQSVRAGKQMERALALEPARAAWREEYIEWLLRWGRADEAHSQALCGRYFSPESQLIRDAVDRTAQVLARGNTPP